jgi:hypothetical protein
VVLVDAGVCCVIAVYVVEWGQSGGHWYGKARAKDSWCYCRV